ncbi:unnamed protein product [Prorocentrum cordatum]|uniref:Uncharacterized protein n=1 Tax=Prorocentrum cordatum TaxID=2364126 RepID=A0ABN9UD36_9DINO|nr:unnamed protein product [Polarella glacialis]
MLTRCAAEVPRALRLHMPPREADLPVLASVAAVVDPLGETTTAFVHLVHLLHASLNVEVCIAMNPRETYDDYPLKKWQRHVFSSGSAKFPGPDRDELSAVFSRLQTHHTLTLAMVCPASWLVTAHKSEHDLDNIRAGDATRLGGPGSQPTVAAEFLLSRLYVEGSAHVRDSGKPATGLQLELQPTLAGPAGGHGGAAGGCGGADTRVMQNHGFWSMPICPGAFVPSLMPGASNDTFVLGSVIPIEVSSFAVPRLPLQVAVRPGRQDQRPTWSARRWAPGRAGGHGGAAGGPPRRPRPQAPTRACRPSTSSPWPAGTSTSACSPSWCCRCGTTRGTRCTSGSWATSCPRGS